MAVASSLRLGSACGEKTAYGTSYGFVPVLLVYYRQFGNYSTTNPRGCQHSQPQPG
jgi:hypothetical protein